MPYTHFRYIAYQVPTIGQKSLGVILGKKNYKAIYGINPGVLDEPKLQGNVNNLSDDAKIRTRRLIGVMIKAEEKIKTIGDNRNTLKVFTAPEFYFRPDNPSLSYTYKEYQAIKDVLRETISKDPRFDNWLIVPGTIMWCLGQSTAKRPIKQGESAYFNTAIYIETSDFFAMLDGKSRNNLKGGWASHNIEKVIASNVDGIPTGRHGGGFSSKISADEMQKRKAAGEMFPKYQTQPKKEKHLFMAGGIQFGLDICMEHSCKINIEKAKAESDIRVVRNTIIKRYEKRVKLHLLVAGGMQISKVSVAAIENGYILRNDGYSKAPMVECKQVDGYRNILTNKETVVNNFYSEASLGQEVGIESPIEIDKGNPLYLKNPLGGDEDSWDGHPQQIKIYESRQLP